MIFNVGTEWGGVSKRPCGQFHPSRFSASGNLLPWGSRHHRPSPKSKNALDTRHPSAPRNKRCLLLKRPTPN